MPPKPAVLLWVTMGVLLAGSALFSLTAKAGSQALVGAALCGLFFFLLTYGLRVSEQYGKKAPLKDFEINFTRAQLYKKLYH